MLFIQSNQIAVIEEDPIHHTWGAVPLAEGEKAKFHPDDGKSLPFSPQTWLRVANTPGLHSVEFKKVAGPKHSGTKAFFVATLEQLFAEAAGKKQIITAIDWDAERAVVEATKRFNFSAHKLDKNETVIGNHLIRYSQAVMRELQWALPRLAN